MVTPWLWLPAADLLMSLDDLLKLALQTGLPMALIAVLSVYLFTKLIPKVIADFRDTLREMHRECQDATKEQREAFLTFLRDDREAHERQLREDREVLRQELQSVTNALRAISDGLIYNVSETRQTKEAVEEAARPSQRHHR